MAVVTVDDVIEIVINATISGRPHVNVLHYKVIADVGLSDQLLFAASKVRDEWQDNIVGLLTSNYVLQNVGYSSLDPSRPGGGLLTPNAGKTAVGGNLAAPLPPSCTFLVKKATVDRPRGKSDGRMYVSGIPEVDVDGFGNISAAPLGNINTGFDEFFQAIDLVGFLGIGDAYPVVLETTVASRAPGAAVVNIGSRKVSGMSVDPMIATQRERLRK